MESGLVVATGMLALLLTCLPRTRGLAFAAWVIAWAAAGVVWPEWFTRWGSLRLTQLIVPLIQIIMFGMGTILSIRDFLRALSRPGGVVVGVVLQFLIMPVVGLLIARAFQFPPEIAAGIVLTGCCAGGVASNVMTYLAGGNVALSVTMTTASTLVSPLLTPQLMQLLAGTFVPIDIVAMMLSILNMIITPILAGLVAHEILFPARQSTVSRIHPGLLLLLLLVLLTSLAVLPPFAWGFLLALRPGFLLGLTLLLVAVLAKLWPGAASHTSPERLERCLSLVSMFSICLIIAIITAATRETLLTAGMALFLAALLHNTLGYAAGYGAARLLKFTEADCRTIAFEVGMQNSGMATGLAIETLKSTSAAVAPALFGPVMNTTGSLLASWWKYVPADPAVPVHAADSEPVQ